MNTISVGEFTFSIPEGVEVQKLGLFMRVINLVTGGAFLKTENSRISINSSKTPDPSRYLAELLSSSSKSTSDKLVRGDANGILYDYREYINGDWKNITYSFHGTYSVTLVDCTGEFIEADEKLIRQMISSIKYAPKPLSST